MAFFSTMGLSSFMCYDLMNCSIYCFSHVINILSVNSLYYRKASERMCVCVCVTLCPFSGSRQP